MTIHPTAVVSTGADLSPDSDIGPFVVVEDDVHVGAGCRIGANTVLKRGLRLGADVQVYEGAVLGGEPQDTKFRPQPSLCEIGAGTVIREFATVHRSTQDGASTRIGERCYLMAYAHVAHDCAVDQQATIASYSALAGHVRVGRRAFVSGGVVVHQFTRIGELAFIGGGSKVNMDVPPFVIVDGVPARAVGLNLVGLRRAGISADAILELRRAFRAIFRSATPRPLALDALAGVPVDEVQRLVKFFGASERGVCRGRRHGIGSVDEQR